MVRVANLALQELVQQRFELLHKHRRLKKTKLLLKAKNKSLLHLSCFTSTAVLGEVLKVSASLVYLPYKVGIY